MTSKIVKRLVLVLFGLIIVVLIIEVLLRFVSWGFYHLQEKQNKGTAASTNSRLGETKDVRLVGSENSEVVILTLGESTTGIGRENSWPSQLQRILNTIQDQKTFRVINKGVPGTETSSIATKLPGYLNKYNPDLVLAMVGINDHCALYPQYCVDSGNLEFVPAKPSSAKFSLASTLKNFRTYGLIKWIAGGIKAWVTGKTDSRTTTTESVESGNREQLPVYNLQNPNVTHLHPLTVRNLNYMVELTAEQGIDFAFVSYALRQIDVVRNVIERDVFYISNYEKFQELLKQYNYEDLFIDICCVDFGHATAFSNRVIADNVARRLLEIFESKNR